MKVESTIYQALVKTASKYPHRKALLFRGKAITYERFIHRVDALSVGLTQFGLKKDDVITFAMPNIFEAVFGFYASTKLGLKCHMVHPITPVKQMRKYMKETSSKVLVVLDTFYNHYKDLKEDGVHIFLANPMNEFNPFMKIVYQMINRKKLNSIKFDDQVQKFKTLYGEGTVNVTNINPKASAVYLHSGGTSGLPKTIELSHHAINYLASQAGYIMGSEDFENKHMLAVLPMFHGFGLCMGIHGMMVSGGVNTLMPKFDAKEAVKLISKNQINYIIGVPSLFESLLKQSGFDSPKMEHIDQTYVGGDYVSLDLKKRFDAQMKKNGSDARLLEGYGLTEVVTVCSVNTLRDHNPKSVGKPVPGIEILIKDLESNHILGPNEDGEIIVTGPTVMNGYLNDKEATENAFFSYDNKTWVRTGDLGHINKDGYLFFKQRLKRIIKVLGIPVLPGEIENLLMDYDQVSEVAAIGIPDKDKGNIVKLFIVWNDPKQSIPFDEIKKIIKENISNYAIPKEMVVLDELPKTVIGKIDVLALEKL
jgi:long-chain acyl-CoA synthetase